MQRRWPILLFLGFNSMHIFSIPFSSNWSFLLLKYCMLYLSSMLYNVCFFHSHFRVLYSQKLFTSHVTMPLRYQTVLEPPGCGAGEKKPSFIINFKSKLF